MRTAEIEWAKSVQNPGQNVVVLELMAEMTYSGKYIIDNESSEFIILNDIRWVEPKIKTQNS